MREPDTFDRYDAEDSPDEDGITCRRCGATGLYWQRVTQADGRGEKSVLFSETTHRRHVCNAANGADAFDTVPE